MEYAVEMLNITKDFPGIRANDDVTIRLKKVFMHCLGKMVLVNQH